MNFLTDKFRQTSLLDVYVFRFLGLFGFWNLTEARCRSDLRLVADSESRGSNVQPASRLSSYADTFLLLNCWNRRNTKFTTPFPKFRMNSYSAPENHILFNSQVFFWVWARQPTCKSLQVWARNAWSAKTLLLSSKSPRWSLSLTDFQLWFFLRKWEHLISDRKFLSVALEVQQRLFKWSLSILWGMIWTLHYGGWTRD